MKKLIALVLTAALLVPFGLSAKGKGQKSDVEKGHEVYIQAYDAWGDYYVEIDDGRGGVMVFGTVESPDDLDPDTYTEWRVLTNYEGTRDFNGYLDSGWVSSHAHGSGYWFPDGPVILNSLMVHKSDPRYNGGPTFPGPVDWEFQVITYIGQGNILKDIVQVTQSATAHLTSSD